MGERIATFPRKTTETDITIKLNIDGEGKCKIDTGIGLLNHMLELFAFWGHFDLDINAKGDLLKVDIHHTNEDVGIVLGEVFKQALGDKKGIKRIGSSSVPMEDVVANVTVDISGRDFYRLNATNPSFAITAFEGKYSMNDAEHFFESFAEHLGMNLRIMINTSLKIEHDLHTVLEAIFKALGLALDQATQIDPRRKGIPSTKGVID